MRHTYIHIRTAEEGRPDLPEMVSTMAHDFHCDGEHAVLQSDLPSQGINTPAAAARAEESFLPGQTSQDSRRPRQPRAESLNDN